MSAALWFGLAVFGGWFAWSMRRLQLYWETGQERITTLGAALRQAQGKLARETQTMERLTGDIKVARRQAETARSDERAARRQREEMTPPAPMEIVVPTEFSSSTSDLAWLAQLTPRFSEVIQPEARPIRYVLVWASGHQAALSRARQIAGERQHSVHSLQRFAEDKG